MFLIASIPDNVNEAPGLFLLVMIIGGICYLFSAVKDKAKDALKSEARPAPLAPPPVIKQAVAVECETEFAVGDVVRHPKFGLGSVDSVTGVGIQAKAVVVFRDGPKLLLLSIAKLEKQV